MKKISRLPTFDMDGELDQLIDTVNKLIEGTSTKSMVLYERGGLDATAIFALEKRGVVCVECKDFTKVLILEGTRWG